MHASYQKVLRKVPMDASESFLSSPDYPYDYVIAVTQRSINDAAYQFLETHAPPVNACYVGDENGKATPIDYELLKKKANGADPFAIPETGPERERLLKDLYKARFMYGFHAVMGLQDGFSGAKVPDLVTLGRAEGDDVQYSLLCKNFLLVELNQNFGEVVFESYRQPNGKDGKDGKDCAPWVFNYRVKLICGTEPDNHSYTKTSAFGKLPTDVQAMVVAAPADFTIQHLLFDFANAAVAVRPEISGISTKLREKLYADFSIKYFAAMEGIGALISAITRREQKDKDPFARLKTAFSVTPFPGQPDLSTLNYLCVTDAHSLPSVPKPFTWRWIEKLTAGVDGVCVISRNELVRHFESQLAPYVDSNCFIPQPLYLEMGVGEIRAGMLVAHHSFDFKGGTPPDPPITQNLTLTRPSKGEVLLHWEFHSDRKANRRQIVGASDLNAQTAFTLKLTCVDNLVIVTQTQYVNYHLMVDLGIEDTKLIDITQVDTYTLAVAGDHLTATLVRSDPIDSSADPQYWHRFPEHQQTMRHCAQTLKKNHISKTFIELPLSMIKGILFPGSKAFLIKDARFSKNQDLVAHISYADPG